MKKISWGTGIVISLIVFVIFSLTKTFYLMNQEVDLVTDDYYKKGLEYQKQIESEQRSIQLSNEIMINSDGKYLTIIFPEYINGKIVNGEILLYRPSDSSLDLRIPLSLENQKQIIPVSSLKKGLWRIKINWNYNNVSYYKESALTL